MTSLPPGDTTLCVGGTGAAVVRVNVPSRGNAVQLAPTGTLAVITPLAEGGVARLRFATAGGLVVPVSLWSSPTRDGWVEAEGGRVTQRLPSGTVIVEMAGPDGAVERKTANVTAGGITTVTFE